MDLLGQKIKLGVNYNRKQKFYGWWFLNQHELSSFNIGPKSSVRGIALLFWPNFNVTKQNKDLDWGES